MPSFAKTYKFNNMKKILQVTILFSLLTVGSFAQKQQQILPADQEIPLKYGANRLGKRSDAAMKKFRDNRLGAFIHWGLYCHSRRRMERKNVQWSSRVVEVVGQSSCR